MRSLAGNSRVAVSAEGKTAVNAAEDGCEHWQDGASPASIGYISDIGMTPENLSRVCELLNGVTLLVSECTFLAEDEEKARNSSHLCTTDLNRISRQVKPDLLLPMHLSKSYIRDTQRLYAELDQLRGTQLLQLPDYMTPRPLLPGELPSPIPRQ